VASGKIGEEGKDCRKALRILRVAHDASPVRGKAPKVLQRCMWPEAQVWQATIGIFVCSLPQGNTGQG
jgi:hypothetical protein